MSRDDYENAVSDLTVARRMAGDSSMLGVLESTLSAMSGAEGARYRAFIGVSRANIAMFRAHATVLEPLLSAFGNLVGSTPQ